VFRPTVIGGRANDEEDGFHPLFLRISQGASRLQEILADRRAADVYGGAAFATGLKHMVACSLIKHEREMTLFVYARLAEQGVSLPALPKA